VNALHTAGFTIETPPAAGLPLFTGTNAATIAVNAAIVNEPRRIAASDTSGVAGNNQIALQMTALQQQNHGSLNDSSFNEFWGAVVTDFGFETNFTNNQFLSRRFLFEQIDADRQGESGVSLDEEAADLMRFQRSYEAAARVVTAIDEMLDRLINGMGVTGR
ncbi:MAG: flagellar hook-associated protein FlgK, partial [Dehalococcoidia bacterium]|nr:flagellar hook-associated protein FlgK [Dehalococcoidia bacterium]